MLLVPRVDPLGAVTGEKILVELEPRLPLEDRHTHLFGAAWVHGRLVNDDSPRAHHLANGFARAHQGGQVRTLVAIDGRRYRHDEDAASLEVGELRRKGQVPGALELFGRDLERGIPAGAQLRHALGLDVEPQGLKAFTKLDRERQPDVPKTYHREAAIAQAQHVLPLNLRT